ncbi:6,7-dimethyl-8-ribityllumazine synthase [Gonapodya prolifera JEL478]|uniref:6,7-dimethyl-8-ribityllumazine synthase n=1 Tax=Gonapodya prolifera (strain JEL478) TaxID=1344416 RepID=A0A139B150_GONPJ|nr:6,7-dimethyl-8-ribityllumazine synthase [Gonapodya prolifera JEL478]|eukprot:KXS22445.1 6,7-dimethyl-8-ribityllumazine synthase [Gonapodya prolifera JEL478]
MQDKTIKGLTPLAEGTLDGSSLKILIIHTRWNSTIVDALVQGCVETLTGTYKVPSSSVTKKTVPGAYELPFACQQLIKTGQYDAVIAVGVLIKGETAHFEYIAEATTHGLMRVQLESGGVPVVFGVLTALNEEQALLRAGINVNGKSGHNHGNDWAGAAVEMALLAKSK